MKRLQHDNTIQLKGRSTLRAYPAGANFQGVPVYENTVNNLVVTVGKGLAAAALIDQDLGLTFHALGTDATAPTVSDTALGAEQARKAWTIRGRSGPIATLEVFYLASEAAYNIAECGVFGGASSTATPDSGILFSHYLQAYDNSAGLVDLTFEYVLEVL